MDEKQRTCTDFIVNELGKIGVDFSKPAQINERAKKLSDDYFEYLDIAGDDGDMLYVMFSRLIDENTELKSSLNSAHVAIMVMIFWNCVAIVFFVAKLVLN